MCFSPADATAGEARSPAGMVSSARGSLTVATSPEDVFRARFIFDRSLGDEVDVNIVYAGRAHGLEWTA